MNKQLTAKEEEFLKYLKRELLFTRIEIREKVPLKELCSQRYELGISFGNEEKLIENIVIDFVLYRNSYPLAGIEIIDEPEEMSVSMGEKMLKDMIFVRLGYEFFRFEDLNNLKEAAKEVKKKISELKK